MTSGPSEAINPRSAGEKGPGVVDGATVTVGSRKGAARLERYVKAEEMELRMSKRIPGIAQVEAGCVACREGRGHGHATETTRAQVDDMRAGDGNMGHKRKEETTWY